MRTRCDLFKQQRPSFEIACKISRLHRTTTISSLWLASLRNNMDLTEPRSKRKAIKEMFRPKKRAHASGFEMALGDHSAAGRAELLAPVESSNSDLRDPSRRSDSVMAGPSAPIAGTHAQPSNAGSPAAQHARTAADIAWGTFKATLPVLEKVSVVCPPLQSAVGGLIKVLAHIDVRIKNRRQACQLTIVRC